MSQMVDRYATRIAAVWPCTDGAARKLISTASITVDWARHWLNWQHQAEAPPTKTVYPFHSALSLSIKFFHRGWTTVSSTHILWTTLLWAPGDPNRIKSMTRRMKFFGWVLGSPYNDWSASSRAPGCPQKFTNLEWSRKLIRKTGARSLPACAHRIFSLTGLKNNEHIRNNRLAFGA
jgi:hypothetical protein